MYVIRSNGNCCFRLFHCLVSAALTSHEMTNTLVILTNKIISTLSDPDYTLLRLFSNDGAMSKRGLIDSHKGGNNQNRVPNESFHLKSSSLYNFRSIGYLLLRFIVVYGHSRNKTETMSLMSMLVKTVPLAQDDSVFYLIDTIAAILISLLSRIAPTAQSGGQQASSSSTSSLNTKQSSSEQIDTEYYEKLKSQCFNAFRLTQHFVTCQ